MAKFWEEFINGHIPNFYKSPYDQLENYVKDCWAAIADSARYAQKKPAGSANAGVAQLDLRR
jgi:UDP:flavonoid glycosyltransferase YjiC (YdhE family)